MAQTDARAGFRLPWNSERSNSEQTDIDQLDTDAVDRPEVGDRAAGQWPTAYETTTGNAHAPQTGEARWPEGDSAVADAGDGNDTDFGTPTAGSTAPAHRKPSKFLADLSKAMQAAAEESRALTLAQFQADAKLHVEQIHGRSAIEAADLRRNADDDVAAVREWSKAEIARIREETETKITARKGRLETEIEDHAGLIQREIERVQARVGAFEAEMDAFFERLRGEDDPTRFATMAEKLPEPPPFDDFAADFERLEAERVASGETVTETVTEAPTDVADDAAWGDLDDAGRRESVETIADVETDTVAEDAEATEATEAVGESQSYNEAGGSGGDGEGFELDREAAFAAIQAAAEAAASAEVASDAAARAEAVADEIGGVREGEGEDGDEPVADFDPTPDFGAAEAEAEASANAAPEGEEIALIGDDALAARLAGLVPGKNEKAGSGAPQTTQLIVIGLVSVASIASFKRHLGRVAGVQSVGVSSGPDGEFLFSVHHTSDVTLRDAIPSMPSFQARVTGSSEGILNVTAHDPESDN
jgi:hypothetical protein